MLTDKQRAVAVLSPQLNDDADEMSAFAAFAGSLGEARPAVALAQVARALYVGVNEAGGCHSDLLESLCALGGGEHDLGAILDAANAAHEGGDRDPLDTATADAVEAYLAEYRQNTADMLIDSYPLDGETLEALIIEPVTAAALRDARQWADRHEAERAASVVAGGRYASSLITWSTFWTADFNAAEWLIEPVVPRGRSVAVYALPKAGKSLFMLYAAACAATGRPVLDRPLGEPIHVVYIDMEMTAGDVRERLADMGFGPADDLSKLHYYLLADLPPLDTAAGGAELLAIAEGHAAEWVIIDTTSRVISGAENDSDTFRALYTNTVRLLKARGITVTRLDHAGKDADKGQRGSSAKNDDVDVVWRLTARDRGIQLKATHRRQSWVPEVIDLDVIDVPLRYVRGGQQWPAGTAEIAAALDSLDVPIGHGRERARRALQGAGHAASNEVVSAALRWRRQRLTGADRSPPVPTDSTTGQVAD